MGVAETSLDRGHVPPRRVNPRPHRGDANRYPRPHRRRDYHRDHPRPGYHGSAGGGGFDKRRRGSCACGAGCSDVYHQTVGKIVLPVVCVWASRPENWPWPMARQRIFVVDCGVILGFCSFPQPSPLLKPGGFVVGSPVVPNISPFAPKEGHAAPNGDRLALYDRDVRSTTCNGVPSLVDRSTPLPTRLARSWASTTARMVCTGSLVGMYPSL